MNSLFSRPITQVKAKTSWVGHGGYYIVSFKKELELLAEKFSQEEKVSAYFNPITEWVEFVTSSYKVMAQFLSHGEVGVPCCVLAYLNPEWKIDQGAFQREAIKSLQVYRLEEKDIIFTATPLRKKCSGVEVKTLTETTTPTTMSRCRRSSFAFCIIML